MRPERAWALKFASALALVAGVGLLSYLQNRDRNPAYWRCRVHPAKFDGAMLWIPGATVGSTAPDGFVLKVDGFDVPVRGDAVVKPGDRVGIRGRFRAEDGRIDLVAWRALSPLASWRWLVEAVSLLVFAVVAWNFLRHFAFRREKLRVEVAP